MDMRSITDRAAQTLLWTELFRGESWSQLDTSVRGANRSQRPHARSLARLQGASPPERAVTTPSPSSRPGHDTQLPFPGAGHHQLPL